MDRSAGSGSFRHCQPGASRPLGAQWWRSRGREDAAECFAKLRCSQEPQARGQQHKGSGVAGHLHNSHGCPAGGWQIQIPSRIQPRGWKPNAVFMEPEDRHPFQTEFEQPSTTQKTHGCINAAPRVSYHDLLLFSLNAAPQLPRQSCFPTRWLETQAEFV